jgi:hypothetical protein
MLHEITIACLAVVMGRGYLAGKRGRGWWDFGWAIALTLLVLISRA